MDPVSALSIAAAASGFLDFGGVLVKKGFQRYQSARDPHVRDELEAVTKELNRICSGLAAEHDSQSGQMTAGDNALRELTKPCQRLANELILELDSLRPQVQSSKSKNFALVLRSMRKDGKIRDLHKRLEMLRNQFGISLDLALK